jgi:hypothetical protein
MDEQVSFSRLIVDVDIIRMVLIPEDGPFCLNSSFPKVIK